MAFWETDCQDAALREKIMALPHGPAALARGEQIREAFRPFAGTGISVEEFLREKHAQAERASAGPIAMVYADYDLKRAVSTFGLTEELNTDLFAAVEPVEPSEFLRGWLDEFAPLALGVNSEKARSELIIAPTLIEAKRRAGSEVNVLPGVTFEVDREQGLAGFCDFLIVRSPEIFYVQGPVVAVVEAKREDLISGLGQCAAEMVAIRLFNEREGTPIPAVFGCVTSGSNWRFLKLEGSKLFIDWPEYYLRDIARILGILVSIARG